MSLKEHLIEKAPKGLITCRQCHDNADVSMSGPIVKLICPRCHQILGSWATTSDLIAELARFVGNSRADY
jgi:hypothetical protein